MQRAWAAGRGMLAVVGLAVVSSAALVSVILVHGLGIFEGLGF